MPQNNSKKSPLFLDEEVNEALGRAPHWLVRWGNALLLGIAASLIVLSMIVYYPDVVTGRAAIVPEGISSVQSPGYATVAQSVFVKDRQQVSKGRVLYVLQSVEEPLRTDTIVASAAGIVQLQRVVRHNATVPAQASLLTIRNAADAYRIQILAPAYKAGKIKLQQRVKITTESYPRDEYGELEAEIISRPVPAADGMVSMDAVLLKDGLTTYGKKLDIAMATAGIATISVARRTVFSRLFYAWR